MWQTATPQACVLLAGEHQSEEGWFHVSEDDVVSVLLQLPGTQQQEGVVGRRRDVIWPWQLPHTGGRSSRGDSDPQDRPELCGSRAMENQVVRGLGIHVA